MTRNDDKLSLWVIANGASSGGGGEEYEETLIWENENPKQQIDNPPLKTNLFPSQLSSYDFIKIEYKNDTSSSEVIYAIFKGGAINKVIGGVTHYRKITQNTTNGLQFEASYSYGRTSTNSTTIIPIAIYGIKKKG